MADNDGQQDTFDSNDERHDDNGLGRSSGDSENTEKSTQHVEGENSTDASQDAINYGKPMSEDFRDEGEEERAIEDVIHDISRDMQSQSQAVSQEAQDNLDNVFAEDMGIDGVSDDDDLLSDDDEEVDFSTPRSRSEEESEKKSSRKKKDEEKRDAKNDKGNERGRKNAAPNSPNKNGDKKGGAKKNNDIFHQEPTSPSKKPSRIVSPIPGSDEGSTKTPGKKSDEQSLRENEQSKKTPKFANKKEENVQKPQSASLSSPGSNPQKDRLKKKATKKKNAPQKNAKNSSDNARGTQASGDAQKKNSDEKLNPFAAMANVPRPGKPSIPTSKLQKTPATPATPPPVFRKGEHKDGKNPHTVDNMGDGLPAFLHRRSEMTDDSLSVAAAYMQGDEEKKNTAPENAEQTSQQGGRSTSSLPKSKKKWPIIAALILVPSMIFGAPLMLVAGLSTSMPRVAASYDEPGQKCDPSDKDSANGGSTSAGPDLGDVGDVTMPAEGVFTSPFGPRWGAFHHGIDIANDIGTPIYAAHGGTVISSGPADGYGLWVRIQSDKDPSLVSIYGHNNANHVKEGDKVKAGQHIADIGNRGESTGPHLHFEVQKDGVAFDPVPWLKEEGVAVPDVNGRTVLENGGGGESESKDDNPSSESSETPPPAEGEDKEGEGEQDSSSTSPSTEPEEKDDEKDDEKDAPDVGCVCQAEGKGSTSSGGAPGAAANGDAEQRIAKYAPIVIGAGRKMGMSDDQIITAIMVVQVESVGWKNWANDGSNLGQAGALVDENTQSIGKSVEMPNDGIATDAASVGLFQQQVSKAWGTVDNLMKPAYQAARFYTRMKQGNFSGSKGEIAADIQQPAAEYRGRYAEQESAATEIFNKYKDKGELSSEEEEDVERAISDFDGGGNDGGGESGGSSSSSSSDGPSGDGDCGTESSGLSGDSEIDESIEGSNAGEIAKKAVTIARKQVGKPYVWGANGPDAFDCSGLISYAYNQAGYKKLKGGRWTTYTMEDYGKIVKSKEDLAVGDAIITNGGDHVMMYIGNGNIIEAQQTGVPVLERPLSEINDIVKIVRFVDEDNKEL